MKKIEVKKFYNELNEINDLSGDYVEVTMPTALWQKLLFTLELMSFTDKTLKNLVKVLNNADVNAKSEWYK